MRTYLSIFSIDGAILITTIIVFATSFILIALCLRCVPICTGRGEKQIILVSNYIF